jgi:general secretion pathway protein D
MPNKRLTKLMAVLIATGLAAPLFAQQAPGPNLPSTNVPTPTAPAQPPTTQQVPTPVVPRRIVPPGQSPAQVQSQQAAPQAQPSAPTPPEAATPPPSGAPSGENPPTPSAPAQRRFSAAPAPGGMISLNFNRADLVEIIHIIAQQLRLTYTIDPEVKGTVTINSAEPLRSEDLLPVFHQILRMNGAVAVRTGNLYHIMPIKDGKGLARPLGQNREDSFALQVIPVRFF